MSLWTTTRFTTWTGHLRATAAAGPTRHARLPIACTGARGAASSRQSCSSRQEIVSTPCSWANRGAFCAPCPSYPTPMSTPCPSRRTRSTSSSTPGTTGRSSWTCAPSSTTACDSRTPDSRRSICLERGRCSASTSGSATRPATSAWNCRRNGWPAHDLTRASEAAVPARESSTTSRSPIRLSARSGDGRSWSRSPIGRTSSAMPRPRGCPSPTSAFPSRPGAQPRRLERVSGPQAISRCWAREYPGRMSRSPASPMTSPSCRGSIFPIPLRQTPPPSKRSGRTPIPAVPRTSTSSPARGTSATSSAGGWTPFAGTRTSESARRHWSRSARRSARSSLRRATGRTSYAADCHCSRERPDTVGCSMASWVSKARDSSRAPRRIADSGISWRSSAPISTGSRAAGPPRRMPSPSRRWRFRGTRSFWVSPLPEAGTARSRSSSRWAALSEYADTAAKTSRPRRNS